jgi:non-ribosomal peptide synthetase component F
MQEVYGFGPHDRFSKAYNLSFDGSVHDMFTCWNAGASLHPVPARQLMAPAKFIQEKQLTMWTSVPSTAVFLERMKMLQPGTFPSLRYTIFSGEPLPLRSALAWQQAAPNSVVDNICGHTECCCFSTLERLSNPPNVTPKLGLVAVGKPLPGFEAAVFDKDCKPLPPGQEGELALAGPQVAQGYFQDAERTAARFPSINGKVWYRTGDLVVVDELGSLHHLGRIDNQVKVLGIASNLAKWNRTSPRSAARMPWQPWPGRCNMAPLGESRHFTAPKASPPRRSATKSRSESRVTWSRNKCGASNEFRSPSREKSIARRSKQCSTWRRTAMQTWPSSLQ